MTSAHEASDMNSQEKRDVNASSATSTRFIAARNAPAFLAAMNLVLVADDAFTSLFSWEFMSLASWALVMAHHRRRGTAAAGYLYLLMARFGTRAPLLACG